MACAAYAAGAAELAHAIAARTWDPEGAPYVSIKSEVCTTAQQQMAYAVREYLGGNSQEARTHLARVRTTDPRLLKQRWMLEAIIKQAQEQFVKHLTDLLADHDKVARRDRSESDNFLCLPAIGLVCMALNADLVRVEHLPQNDVFMPLELLVPGSG
jgi:hypothetical protein